MFLYNVTLDGLAFVPVSYFQMVDYYDCYLEGRKKHGMSGF